MTVQTVLISGPDVKRDEFLHKMITFSLNPRPSTGRVPARYSSCR